MLEPLRHWWRGLAAAWHYGRGKGAYKRGRYTEAARRFRRCDELAPGASDARAWILKSERAAGAAKR